MMMVMNLSGPHLVNWLPFPSHFQFVISVLLSMCAKSASFINNQTQISEAFEGIHTWSRRAGHERSPNRVRQMAVYTP